MTIWKHVPGFGLFKKEPEFAREHKFMAEIERLRAALQRIVDGHGAVPDRDIAWAALNPQNVVKVVDGPTGSD